MHTDIIDKFTTHLKHVLSRALCLVVETKGSGIEPLHLVWALATQKGSIGAEILHKAKITEKAVDGLFPLPERAAVKEIKEQVETLTPKLSIETKRAIEKAILTANVYEHKYVGTEHLLSGVLQIEDASVKKFLEDHKVDLKILRQQITMVLKSTSKFPDLAASLGGLAGGELQEMGQSQVREKRRGKKGGSKTPALDFFAVDLTTPEIQTKIDPVIGREVEIERLMQILCRRTKNNPILLGDPGVGKTAIVEGLAKKITNGEVPDVLQGKRILSLDLSLIIAGTMYRGEFEGRLKQIIDETKANPEVILFIDEVHTIIGAGSASGSLDAANILKPALARGEIRCIGATTTTEFKKHIESDPALERRFQSVLVDEPSPEKTLKILEGLKTNYEKYHGVTISKEAIVAAVDLAHRYLTDKFFPDKAIDLIDEAASSIRVRQKASPVEKKIRELEADLNRLQEEKRQAITNEHFIEAIALKEQERAVDEQIKKIERTRAKRKTGIIGRLGAKNIAEVVSRATGIPVQELIDTEKERLKNLESVLEQHILGQTKVVHTVADCIRRAKTGIAHPNRPLASFLFVGPSGVGKTELAKVIAEEVFQDPNALVRLDMSEFSEGFTVSKLIGAPAGYVGYKESAKLTDAIKRKPYSVVLFDELEKAHNDILNLLLQILDEGHITDAAGKKINFKNTIVIMTSNVGSDRLHEHEVGFGAELQKQKNLPSDIQTSLGDRFRPEFLNRIDRVCIFEILKPETLTAIVDLQIKELNERLKPHHLAITIDDTLRNWIVKNGTREEHGARALRRVIQDHIEGQLASFLLETSSKKQRILQGTLQEDKPVFTDR